jgi:hypothetical protein
MFFEDVASLSWEEAPCFENVDPHIHTMFSHLKHFVVRGVKKDQSWSCMNMKVGVVLSGGQASGGHNVIAGCMMRSKRSVVCLRWLDFVVVHRG